MHNFQNAGEGRNGAPRSVDAHGGKRMAKAMEIGIYFAFILSSLRSSSSKNKNKEERKMKGRYGRSGKGIPSAGSSIDPAERVSKVLGSPHRLCGGTLL